jgi:HD-GYP domain-containing protein (c-di-GMP phosphodiesterase class II)
MSLLSSFVVLSRNNDLHFAERPLPMIEALARARAARDGSTHAHARRVQRYAVALAGEISIAEDRTLAAIDATALLHDIGKLSPIVCSTNPGPLAVIVRHHHENWDGTGYPDGLRGKAIPIGARVLSIVDCYDALTSDRPYRRALSHGSAVAMIHERSGTMYDPEIVSAFLRIVQRVDATPRTMARAI